MTVPPGPPTPPEQPPTYGQPPSPAVSAHGAFAGWGERVVSALIDYFAPFIVAGVLFRVSAALGVILYLLALAWVIYNKVLEGRTGQSYGKQAMNIRLLGEESGQPVGAGLAIGRWLLHIVDGIPCYLGYLWPLWDAKKQTFSDKIVKTVVVKAG